MSSLATSRGVGETARRIESYTHPLPRIISNNHIIFQTLPGRLEPLQALLKLPAQHLYSHPSQQHILPFLITANWMSIISQSIWNLPPISSSKYDYAEKTSGGKCTQTDVRSFHDYYIRFLLHSFAPLQKIGSSLSYGEQNEAHLFTHTGGILKVSASCTLVWGCDHASTPLVSVEFPYSTTEWPDHIFPSIILQRLCLYCISSFASILITRQDAT